MTTPERVDGFDASNWQKGVLDLGAAEKAGCRWMYHKATEGTSYQDPNYATRRAQAKRAGMPFGAYHFARPTRSSGVAQARYFLAYAKPAKGDMRPMLDLEDQAVANWAPAKLTAWVKSFVDEVVRQTGVPPFIYTRFTLTSTFDCPLWVASYANDNRQPHVPAPWKTWTVWQFSDGVYGWPTSEPGVGHVDLNTMNGDPAKLTEVFRLGYKAPAPPAPKPPAPKPPVAKPPVVKPPVITPPTPHVVPPPIIPTPLGQPTTVRIGTLNVNQFHSTAAASADIAATAPHVDVLMLQETSKVFVADVLKGAFDVRQNATDSAKKNVAIAWRKNHPGMGGAYVLGSTPHGRTDVRSRWLDWEDITVGKYTVRFCAAHRHPFRDAILWQFFDKSIRDLADSTRKAGLHIVVGVDSNAANPKRLRAMEIRTGLRWHGIGIDGFLTSLPNESFANVRALPKGNSDHRAIVADLTI